MLLLSQTTAKTEKWVCQAGPLKSTALIALALRSSGVVVGMVQRQHIKMGRVGGEAIWCNTSRATWQECQMQMVSCWFTKGLCHRWMPVLPLSQTQENSVASTILQRQQDTKFKRKVLMWESKGGLWTWLRAKAQVLDLENRSRRIHSLSRVNKQSKMLQLQCFFVGSFFFLSFFFWEITSSSPTRTKKINKSEIKASRNQSWDKDTWWERKWKCLLCSSFLSGYQK